MLEILIFGPLIPCGGSFTVDCFANSVNAKVSRFYSMFFQPRSLAVDSLAFDWGQENCWFVPPGLFYSSRFDAFS